ncbi:MAG: DnaJ family domain-containing protein [Phototrophicaceae bacterium]|jgi:hypothetical protein
MVDESWLSPVERAIREAMQAGMFDNLPGFGKPLQWSEAEAYTPEDKRLAYKIMQENDVAPDWMMLGASIEEQQQRLRRELARGWSAYRGALADADRVGDLGRRSRVTRGWERLVMTFQEAFDQYNYAVMNYNLKVPPGVPQRHFMGLDDEVKRLEK